MTDNIKHLLGGYATGTLTPEENAALMEAALGDQELFDALADDEALRRYLADPAFRKDLLKATAPRPSRLPLIAGLLAAAASLSIGIFWMAHRDNPPATQMAVVRPPAVEPPPVPAPVEPVKKQPVPVAPKPVKAKRAQPAPSAAGGQPSSESVSIMAETAPPVPKAAAPASASVAYAPRPAIPTQAFARAALLPPQIVTGKITDVNAAIITVNVGTKAGVKIGDRLDILHDNTNIGYITISVTDLEYAVGKYTGEQTPAIGDTAATPKK